MIQFIKPVLLDILLNPFWWVSPVCLVRGFGGLVDQARSSGLPKDLRTKPKREKPTPETHYEDGWVSLTDIQKTHAKSSKDDGG